MIRITLLSALGLFLSACAHSAAPEPNAEAAVTAPDYGTAAIDRSTPQATAYSMMIAMYRGDVDMVDRVFAPDATLNRLRPSGEVRRDGLTPWRDWVGTLNVGQAHEELFNLKVEQYGRLASVWAPFVIRIDGEIRGCGVNQFTMVDMGEDDAREWRILSGIDVQGEKEGCAEFRRSFR